jgi:hypothetical protein
MSNGRRTVFSVIHPEFVATQRYGTHISAVVNQHATIEETVFSVGAVSRLYNEDLRQLRDRTEGGYGGCSREDGEEIGRKELGSSNKHSCAL